MIITFLGTGTSQGVPVIACNCNVCLYGQAKDRRLRSSVLIENNGFNIIIDAGPDFRQQMLKYGITRLEAIVITHGHKDHIGGLDDVRAFNYMQQRPMDIFAPKEAHIAIKNEFFYAFEENKYPGVPKINLHEIDINAFSVGAIEFIPVKVKHFNKEIRGYRCGNFAYITDASFIADEEKRKLLNLEVLVINALRKKPHYSHFNLQQAVELIKELKPVKAYLTHVSHLMGFHEEVNRELPDYIRLAYDGLKINVN